MLSVHKLVARVNPLFRSRVANPGQVGNHKAASSRLFDQQTRDFSIKTTHNSRHSLSLPTYVSQYEEHMNMSRFGQSLIPYSKGMQVLHKRARPQQTFFHETETLVEPLIPLPKESEAPAGISTLGEMRAILNEKARHNEKVSLRWQQLMAACASAGVLLTADGIAQGFEMYHDKERAYDYRRTAALASFGFFYYGAFVFRLYRGYDMVFGASNAMAKSAFDVGIHAPFGVIPAFYGWKLLWEGHTDLDQAKAQFMQDWLPASTASVAYWLPIQCVCFSVVPMYYRILWVSCGSFVHKTGLSWYAYRQKALTA